VYLGQVDDHLVSRNTEIGIEQQPIGSEVLKGHGVPLREIMEVLEGDWPAQWPFRPRIQFLGPHAKITVTGGRVVYGVPIGRELSLSLL